MDEKMRDQFIVDLTLEYVRQNELLKCEDYRISEAVDKIFTANCAIERAIKEKFPVL